MPAYDYTCEKCGHTFELRQSFNDDPITVCPECGGRVRRLFSPPPIIFKGSGWYVTDSKSANPSLKSAKTDAKSSEKAEVEAKEPAKTDEKATTTPAEAPAAETAQPAAAKPSDKT